MKTPEEQLQDVLPNYTAEVAIWGTESTSQPVFKMSVSGTAKVVSETITAGLDSFREDAER